jgi:hypothetical protein
MDRRCRTGPPLLISEAVPGSGAEPWLFSVETLSRSLTWWLCSACPMTSAATRLPRAGSSVHRGIALISPSPTASVTPSMRMNTP